MNLVLSTPPPETFPDTVRVNTGELITLEAPEGMQEYVWSNGSSLPYLDVNTNELTPEEADIWVQMTDVQNCVWYDNLVLLIQNYKREVHEVTISADEPNGIFDIYPNPANEKIFIKSICTIDGEVKLELISAYGQVLFYQECLFSANKILEIHTADFSPGSYQIRISYQDNKLNYKLIIY
jgi:hypothetical protein